MDLQLDLLGQIVQFGSPRMLATDALNHDDGEASHDERAAVVMALGTDQRERAVSVRHGLGMSILLQSLPASNAGSCNRLN